MLERKWLLRCLHPEVLSFSVVFRPSLSLFCLAGSCLPALFSFLYRGAPLPLCRFVFYFFFVHVDTCR